MPTSTVTMTPLSMNPLTKEDARAGRREPSWKSGQGWMWPAQVPPRSRGHPATANVVRADLAQGGPF